MNPQKLAKWQRWLGDANTHGTIIRDIVDLAMIRMIYSGVKSMVEENDELQQHSAFHSVFSLNYAHTVLMYVRRQVRPHLKSVGLIMLVKDVRDNCEMITREFYVDLYTRNAYNNRDLEWRQRIGNLDFDRFAGTVGDHFDPAIADADLEKLEAIAEASGSFIDRRLAHLDRREPTHVPTHEDLETWCDTLNAQMRNYIALLRATDYQITPVLSHDWKDIFRVSWLPA